MIGTTEAARVNAVLVLIKVAALTAFVALTLPSSDFDSSNFNPFLPAGVFGGFGTGVGAVGAAATIFFAYVGFDAVSTAAEETKNPQRNVPIGLIGSLLFRSEEHTSELQSLMRISYAVLCLKKKKKHNNQ